jgi:cellulose synthase/poly-beta-1,6-N-acetylglucosamine synthase-like glycosyltransferase
MIDYSNYIVYVLDDSARDEVRELAAEFGFQYIRRPNQGEYKKAGNLRHAFALTSGEFYLVLDADMVPRSDIIKEMVWEFVRDPKLGILQTPHFFRVTKYQPIVERGASLMQEVFYRVNQPAWGLFGASICCGSNAMYRRETFIANGGPALIALSEDVCTGLIAIQQRYTVKYVNIILATGLSPDTVNGYISQLLRWSTGSWITRTSPFLWHPNVPTRVKLIYWSSVVYFTTCALGVVGFGLPGVVNLWFHTVDTSFFNYGLIGPTVVLSTLVKWNWSVLRWDYSIFYSAYLIGYISLVGLTDWVTGKTSPWVPTNVRKRKAKSSVKVERLLFWVPLIFLVTASVGVAINHQEYPGWGFITPLGVWFSNFAISRIILHQLKVENEEVVSV